MPSSVSASGGGPAMQQRKESESSVASGSGQPHPHPEKKKPTTKAERRAQQVYMPVGHLALFSVHPQIFPLQLLY